MRKFNIRSFPERQGPTPFDQWFDQIKKIGNLELDKYSVSAQYEAVQKPWRKKVWSRADIVAAKAGEAARDDSNEDTWRLCLESEILSRFEIEVTW